MNPPSLAKPTIPADQREAAVAPELSSAEAALPKFRDGPLRDAKNEVVGDVLQKNMYWMIGWVQRAWEERKGCGVTQADYLVAQRFKDALDYQTDPNRIFQHPELPSIEEQRRVLELSTVCAARFDVAPVHVDAMEISKEAWCRAMNIPVKLAPAKNRI